jgi:hypothetical protein
MKSQGDIESEEEDDFETQIRKNQERIKGWPLKDPELAAKLQAMINHSS